MYDFIINPTSGGGAGIRLWENTIRPYLDEHQISYQGHILESGYGAIKTAHELTTDGGADLVVIGGDGTINGVLNGIADFAHTRVGFLPTGSGNDFCYGMGFTGDTLTLLKEILEVEEAVSVDLGRVYYGDSNRIFGISCGIGIDAKVCRLVSVSKLKKILNVLHFGSLTYGLLTLKLLFTHPMTRGTMTFDGASDGSARMDLKKTYFMMSMNLPYEGGHVPMAPQASPMDGKLTFCCMDQLSRPTLLFSFLKLLKARQDRMKAYTMLDTAGVEIELEMPMELHADGEVFGEYDHVRMVCLHGQLRVLMKRNR